MRFNELSEQERVQSIKNNFTLLIEKLASDPKKVADYIKVEKPKLNVASLEKIKETMTEDQKKEAEERNKIVQAKVDDENAKLEAEFNSKQEMLKKAEKAISSFEKNPGCICGTCININLDGSLIPPELEALIDIARKEAQEKVY